MQLVPVPTTLEYLSATLPLWGPFLPDIARRGPYSVQQLLEQIHEHDVQPILIINDNKQAVALLGIMIVEDEGARVAEWIWMVGKRREDWQHLLPELERYLREHVQCAKCRPICRPGWRRFLVQHGYKVIRPMTKPGARAHLMMEKVL